MIIHCDPAVGFYTFVAPMCAFSGECFLYRTNHFTYVDVWWRNYVNKTIIENTRIVTEYVTHTDVISGFFS